MKNPRQMPTAAEVEALCDKYPAGTRIRLTRMLDDDPVPEGTCGSVMFVDDAGNIHMKWDNGRGLALIEGVDWFEIIKEEEQA